MPRRATWPPSVLFHRSTGQDRIRWKGQDIYLGPSGTPAARQKYLSVIAEIERTGSVAPPGSDLTVTELVAWWKPFAERTYRGTSREPKEIERALAVLLDLFGRERADAITPRKLATVRAELGRRYSRKVANRRLVRIKTVYKRATEEEVIPGHVYAALQSVRAIPPGTPGVKEHPPRRASDAATIAAALTRCPAPVAAMLAVAGLTGMRPGEVRLMRAGQVELCTSRNNVPLIYRRTPADGHKTAYLGRVRTVPIGPQAARILAPWLHAAKEDGGYVFRPTDSTRGLDEPERCYTDMTLPQAVRRAAEAAGVSLTPGQLRHAFKAAAALSGAGAMEIMSALGQSSTAAFDEYARGDTAPGFQLARRIG